MLCRRQKRWRKSLCGTKKSSEKKNQKNNGSTKNCKIALPKVCACVAHGKCLSFSFSFSFSFSLSLTLLIFSAPPRQTKRCASLSCYLFVSCLFSVVSRCTPLLPLLSLSRQTKRIVRPLVLGTLFRACSFRNRYALCTELKRSFASRSEALSPLRLSI